MNAPITPQAPYPSSPYRSNAIPTQPPHRWPQDANRASPTRVSLRWGHYAHLEPWQDVDVQLQPGMRPHLDGKSEDALYINHKRWNFDNTSKWMILIPCFKWLSILLVP